MRRGVRGRGQGLGCGLRVVSLGLSAEGLGFEVGGFELRVLDWGLRGGGPGVRVKGLGLRVSDSGVGIQIRVPDSGFRFGGWDEDVGMTSWSKTAWNRSDYASYLITMPLLNHYASYSITVADQIELYDNHPITNSKH